jgi:hypothetical protein
VTENEKTLARELDRCVFFPGIGTKRFARDMAFAAAQPEPGPLTPAQRRYLLTAVVRYRRQIPADIVKLAEAELEADAAGAAPC